MVSRKIQSTTLSPYLTDPLGQEHPISSLSITLGRAIECGVVIANTRVSREHTRIFHEGYHWFIEDLHSTNGTYLNNERIIKIMELRDGDTILAGDISFTFHDPETTTADIPLPDLDIDILAGIVRINRKKVSLSPKEYSLVIYLYENRQNVCTKDEIGHAVWPEYISGDIFDYQIENLVRRLRKRIEIDPAKPQLLVTIRGLGYKLNVP